MNRILLFAIFLAGNCFFLNTTAHAQCSNPPVISTPIVNSITENTATIGATLDFNGGGSGCDANYEMRYSTSTPVGASNPSGAGITNNDAVPFTAAIAGLTAGTKYYYKGYASNSNSNAQTADDGSVFFYTRSSAPGSFLGTLDATVNGNNIDLDFGKASQLPLNAHGYIVLRRAGSDPDLSGISDGAAQSSPYYLTTINDSTDVDFTDNTALGGVAYRYALVPYRVVDDGGIVASTYNYGALSPIETATVPLVTTIDEITGGIAPSPLNSSATTQAILGFSVSSNGTPNFTAINIAVTSSALNKFSNAYLYESANNSFGGDSPVGSVSDNLTGTQIQLSGFNVALSSTPKYFFIVVDVQDTVSSTSPTLTPSFTNANVTISGGGTITVNASPITGDTYSFADTAPPTIASTTPADNATGISILLNQLSITFNEPVTYVGDNSDADNMIRVREISVDYIDTIEVADISVVGNTVTFLTDAPFEAGNNYTIRIGNSVFEDAVGNPFVGILTGDNTTWNFTIESAPNISSLSTATRCIGDQLTITGSRFTGTGGSGNTKPFVFINGVQVLPANVTAFNSTSITLTVPTGATTGNVTVQNQDNLLTSNGSALTVHPQINTGLTVTPATLNPAQNTNVNIDILSTQDNNFTYSLILTSAPGGYSVAPGTTVHADVGNNGTRTLNTSEGTDPDLTEIGDYTYRIDVSRTGCTTRTLNQTPFTLTVASLSVTVNATDTSICAGNSAILIGSTSGGTGYYQFSWSGPDGFSDNSSAPEINPAHPAGTGWYVLTLSDNSSNTAKDSVHITTFPSFAVSFEPVDGASSIQTEYTNQNQLFELNASPSQLISDGATFSGAGVVARSDSNKYYFNPQLAGNGIHTITYSFNNGNCTNSTTINFRVSSTFIDGLDQFYCENATLSDPLSLSSIGNNYLTTYYPTYTFTRLRFLRYEYTPGVGYKFNYYDPITQASLEPLYRPNPVGQPNVYVLDVQELVANHEVAPPNTSYYVVVFARDANKAADLAYVDEAVLYNYFRVVPLGVPPNIVGINEAENICSDAIPNPIELSQSIVDYSINNFSIAGTYSGSVTGSNFNPNHSSLTGSGLSEIPLTLTLNYDDNNGCVNTTVRNFNWVKKPNAPFALDTAYCQITSGPGKSYTIDARPNGPATNPFWYELDPVGSPDRNSNPVLDSVNFKGFTAPGINGLTSISKDFYVTQSYKGCEGSVKIVNIEIKEAPEATITREPICENRDFLLNGPEESAGVPYSKYDWTFGDGQFASVLNDSTIIHNYGPGTGAVPYTISLTITNSSGCTNTDVDGITVGSNPALTSFTYQQVCENDITSFQTTPGQIQIESYEWDFGDSSPVIGPGDFPSIDHSFPSVGNYKVKVKIETPAECYSIDSVTVSILEYLTFDSDNPYRMADLNGGNGFWSVEDLNGNTSWQFAPPATMLMDDFTSSAWITNPAGNYLPDEYSFVNSPCLNIQNIQRPVLSLDYILNTDENRDGVVMEYSKDGGVNWQALGTPNSGLNWFNTPAFFTGVIGNSTIGWSGDSWNLADNILNDTLVQGKRALDNLANLSPSERAKVRFRIAFKTDGTRELEGFGFNNLNIESRNRFLLIENFTNESDAQYGTNNTAFKALPATDIVKLQYHMPFPGDDSINPDNQADPGSRAAFYGVTNDNSIFPRVYVDGTSKGDFNDGWFLNYSSLRSLKTSPFEITISTAPSANPNELTLSVDAKALEAITYPAYRKPILQIAIIEKVVGDNEFVLRKLLPNAAGTELALPIAQDAIVSVGPIVWSSTLADPSDIAIIAFIQDEITKEVYQAGLLTDPTNLPTIITGTESTFADRLMIYPNPAKEVLNIKLPEVAKQVTPIQMIDNVGRVVYDGSFKIGEQTKTISTPEFSNGFYLLKIQAANGEVALKKVIITHSN